MTATPDPLREGIEKLIAYFDEFGRQTFTARHIRGLLADQLAETTPAVEEDEELPEVSLDFDFEWTCRCGQQFRNPHARDGEILTCYVCGQRSRFTESVTKTPPVPHGDDTGAVETYTVEQIRKAFDRHASNDDWGVPSLYEDGLISALRGEYDKPTPEES